MRYQKPLQLLWITGIVLLATLGRTSAQVFWNPNHAIGTITGKYYYAYNQSADQLIEIYPAWIFLPGGGGYQWESSTTPILANFTPISGANQSSYTPTGLVTQNMYYRRKTYSLNNPSNFIYSNIVKLTSVSTGWEDINYVREHEVMVTGITDWPTVDQLPIGQKEQTTTYVDGLGRMVQKVDRETATPATSGGTWGDLVQFSQYDATGREPLRYLAYTTTTQIGKYKSAPLTDQPQYFTNTYNETAAYSTITYDNSPLNKVLNIKDPGTTWASSAGSNTAYDVNTAADNVQIMSSDYVQGDAPIIQGPYPANSLWKITYTDEHGKQVIEYRTKADQLVLKKVQVDDVPTAAHSGWACTYTVYDDLGFVRFQIQPEGVKYLDANAWSFAGANGAQILAEQCFQYTYDDKGRIIWKKAPGAAPLNMLYDSRDRLVFTQDGNQAARSPGEWTGHLYDELDRPTITTLYVTTKTRAQLQQDIDGAVITTLYNSISSQPNPVTDLTFTTRTAGVPLYSAGRSITFQPGFASGTNDPFVAQIDPVIETSVTNAIKTIILADPIPAATLANPSVCTILKYYYYDNYAFTGAKGFATGFTNTTAYDPASDANVLPIAASQRVTGKLTGTSIRVMGTNTFLNTTDYFDEKARPIQTLRIISREVSMSQPHNIISTDGS